MSADAENPSEPWVRSWVEEMAETSASWRTTLAIATGFSLPPGWRVEEPYRGYRILSRALRPGRDADHYNSGDRSLAADVAAGRIRIFRAYRVDNSAVLDPGIAHSTIMAARRTIDADIIASEAQAAAGEATP